MVEPPCSFNLFYFFPKCTLSRKATALPRRALSYHCSGPDSWYHIFPCCSLLIVGYLKMQTDILVIWIFPSIGRHSSFCEYGSLIVCSSALHEQWPFHKSPTALWRCPLNRVIGFSLSYDSNSGSVIRMSWPLCWQLKIARYHQLPSLGLTSRRSFHSANHLPVSLYTCIAWSSTGPRQFCCISGLSELSSQPLCTV